MEVKNLQEKTYVRPEPKELKWHRSPWDSLFFILMFFLAITVLCICHYALKLNGYISGIVAGLAAGLPIYLYINHMQSTMRRFIADFCTTEGFTAEKYKVRCTTEL